MCQPPRIAVRFSAFSEFESQALSCIGAIDIAGEIQGKTMLVSRAVLVFESSPKFMEKKKNGQVFLQVGGAPLLCPETLKRLGWNRTRAVSPCVRGLGGGGSVLCVALPRAPATRLSLVCSSSLTVAFTPLLFLMLY